MEREEQLARVKTWLAAQQPAAGQVMLLEGTVGAGKTEFLRAVVQLAHASEVILLNAVCSAGERELPFGTLSQLFDSPVLPVELRRRITPLLRGLMESTRAENMHEAVESNRAEILYDLFQPVTELAATTPVVVCVDDIDHMDAASQQCLLFLIRRLSTAPILMVLTELAESNGTHSPFHAELLRQSSVASARIGPLSPQAVHLLTGLRLGTRGGREFGDSFAERSGGNPLLLDALIHDARLGGGTRQRVFGRALLNCLHRSRSHTLRVARAMAVYGDGATAEQLGELVGTDPSTVERALRTMTEAGLLRDGRFRHELAARTILDDLPAEDRAQLHQRAARLLYHQGGAVGDAAHHLAEAGRVSEPWALRVLLEASSEALLHGRVQRALRYLNSAQDACTNERDRWTARARLAQAEWQLNPSASLRHLLALTEAVRSDQLDPYETMLLVRQLLWLHRTQEAVDILALLRKRATRLPSAGIAASSGTPNQPAELHDMEVWLACTYPPLAGRVQSGPAPTDPEGAPTTRGRAFWLQSIGVLSGGLVRRRSGEMQEWASHVLGQLDLNHNGPWAEEATLLALMSLVYSGRLSEAANRCRSLDERRTGSPSPMWQGILNAAEAEIRLRVGDLSEAVTHGERALEHVSVQGWGTAAGLPLGTLILAHTRMGDLDCATALVTQGIPDEMFQSRYGLHYLYARGHYYLAMNRTRAALGDFLSCGELMGKWGLDLPGIVPWRTSAAEAWLLQGNRDQAKRLVKEQLSLPGPEDTVSRALALRLMAVFSSLGQRPRLLTEAADILEAGGATYELARTLADLGRAYHALGKHRRARVIIRRAWRVAHLCQAEPLCRELLPDTGVETELPEDEERATAVASLTNSERRIASMAVMGYTNREIAKKLFITHSTVEQHLTRVYRKLAVKNRQSLPGYLRGEIG
ncbi:helix-turn-helix transcriptional regulator [Streptomyces sp. P9-A2]|uniref:helix-turn-helix transcriptional regulator n=1 Tax=Streptomyces sp. P9-A2 TaxID=3072284 RepID=UPI002FCA7548